MYAEHIFLFIQSQWTELFVRGLVVLRCHKTLKVCTLYSGYVNYFDKMVILCPLYPFQCLDLTYTIDMCLKHIHCNSWYSKILFAVEIWSLKYIRTTAVAPVSDISPKHSSSHLEIDRPPRISRTSANRVGATRTIHGGSVAICSIFS